MLQTQALANVTHNLNAHVMDVSAKVQHGRSLHMHEMGNLYMEACLWGLPSPYLSLLETTMSARHAFNSKKLNLDTEVLSDHTYKLNQALAQNSYVLSGGGGILRGGEQAHQALEYASKRSAALFENLNQKLMHDQSVHSSELSNLYNEAVRTNMPPSYVALAQRMVGNRQMFDARKLDLNAMAWANSEMHTRQQLHRPLSETLMDAASDDSDSSSDETESDETESYKTDFSHGHGVNHKAIPSFAHRDITPSMRGGGKHRKQRSESSSSDSDSSSSDLDSSSSDSDSSSFDFDSDSSSSDSDSSSCSDSSNCSDSDSNSSSETSSSASSDISLSSASSSSSETSEVNVRCTNNAGNIDENFKNKQSAKLWKQLMQKDASKGYTCTYINK